ncbi:hypothetical protein CVT26_015548 [Gymnopilus dilepis]|uniref:Uncharacterized protein n=1 Tax=Gymnopilus dilepis TaxID=231916 RepID=A0A409YD53_9AGAR|nr:hypothetical protein CVT26_015548 [Gymnopilus dilepis]
MEGVKKNETYEDDVFQGWEMAIKGEVPSSYVERSKSQRARKSKESNPDDDSMTLRAAPRCHDTQ